jgi:hypothetical protein
LDGKAGFVIAGMSAFGVFVKYAKLMELQRKGAATGGESGGA